MVRSAVATLRIMGTAWGEYAVVIEDDDGIRELIATVLEQMGLRVLAASDGLEGVAKVREHQPLIVTIDVNMPGIDGFETAKRVRAISSAYIIMLTARDEEIDALQGLGSGADDYVLKPFRPRELRARAEAMLRRPRILDAGAAAGAADAAGGAPAAGGGAGPRPAAPRQSAGRTALQHNGVVLDPAEHTVTREGREVELTYSEFELLHALLRSGRTVRSKDELARLLRGGDYLADPYVGEADRRGVEVHIGNLRKKLSDSAGAPYLVETVRGVGYRLAAPRE